MRTGASRSIALLKPAAPSTTARHEARDIAAAASAPRITPAPKQANRIPKTSAPEWSVVEASTGRSTRKLSQMLITVVTRRTSRTSTERQAYASPLADPGRGCLHRGSGAVERVELGAPHQQQAGEHREERGRVDREAPARADRGDQDAADGRPDDAAGVEDARVERDRVRQLVAADELEGERVAVRRVEHERGTAEEREREVRADVGDAREGEPRQPDRDEHRARSG